MNTIENFKNILPVATNEKFPVNARDLHYALEIKTEFKDWIRRRLEETDAVEEKDFSSILSESTGGRPSREYELNLILAKEISILERNAIGKLIRRYLIACEEELTTYKKQLTGMTTEDLIIMQAQSVKELKVEVQEVRQVQTEALQEVNELKQEAKQLNTRLDNTPIRSDGVKRTKIHQKIKQYAIAKGGAPTHYRQAHRQLRSYFDVTAFDDIPIRRYDEAMSAIQAWIDEEEHQREVQSTLYENTNSAVA